MADWHVCNPALMPDPRCPGCMEGIDSRVLALAEGADERRQQPATPDDLDALRNGPCRLCGKTGDECCTRRYFDCCPDCVHDRSRSLPLHRTEAGYPNCSTCDGGGCPDCTDPA